MNINSSSIDTLLFLASTNSDTGPIETANQLRDIRIDMIRSAVNDLTVAICSSISAKYADSRRQAIAWVERVSHETQQMIIEQHNHDVAAATKENDS